MKNYCFSIKFSNAEVISPYKNPYRIRLWTAFFFSGKEEKGGCITGDGDKCLTCDEVTNECVACNLGYRLENGKCILNHSFKAVYKTEKKEQKIDLIKYFGEYDIINTIIDGVKAEVCKDYTFTDPGEHTDFYLLNLTNHLELTKMFYGIEKLMSITFTPLFDTQNVINMKQMFQGCTSLETINISSLNLKKVKTLE